MAALRRVSLHVLEHVGRQNPSKSTSLGPLLPPSLFSSRRSIAYRLFVGGLPHIFTEKSLLETFSPFGEIVEVKVPMNKDSEVRSRGFGFVTFGSLDEARRAVMRMNGKIVGGCRITVDFAKLHSTAAELPIASGPPPSVNDS